MKKIILFFAFIGITALNSVQAQDTIAFGYCGYNLTWKLTRDSVLTISGSGAMENYTMYYGSRPWDDLKFLIKTIIINNGVTTIGERAFYQTFNFASVIIPNSVTKLGNESFWACNGLTVVTIPYSVITIGSNVFEACSSLTSINVETNNPNYSSNNGVLYNKMQNTLICCPAGWVGSFTIPDFVTTVSERAFENCRKLTSIAVPSSVLTVGASAFNVCTSMTAIDVDEDNVNYSSNDGIFYNKLQDILICCPSGKTGAISSIPNTVITIEDYAFNVCRVTSVILPNSVTTIGKGAFDACNSLTSITIPENVTSIGIFAFMNCMSLQTVNYNAINCITMGEMSVFSGGQRFTTLNIGNQVKTIPNSAFRNCTYLLYVTIGDSVATIGDYAFNFCINLTSITSNAITPPVLGTNAFRNVRNTIPVHIPCLTYNNYSNASGWSNFTNYIIDGTVSTDTAFYNVIKCYNTPYTDSNFTTPIYQAGVYYTAVANSTGCDSIICLTLETYPFASALNIATADDHFTITWQGDATSYDLYRNDSLLATLTATTYMDNDLIYGVTYCYKVEAIDGNCESNFSNTVCQTFNNVGIVGTGRAPSLRVYPNPTNGQLRITNYAIGSAACLQELRDGKIEIYDVVGKLQQSKTVNLKSEIMIDISHLANGMYYLKVGNKTMKFIKE